MTDEVQVAILVADGFIPTELALTQDILRIASRLSHDISFATCMYSLDGADLVEGVSGILARTMPLPADEAELPSHLIVLGGKGAGNAVTQLRTRLRWFERTGRNVILLSDAAFEWKRLHPNTDEVTTHWEIQQRERDAGFDHSSVLPLFSHASRITTAAGMTSTADVVMNRIVAPLSLRLAQSVGQVLLLDRIREGDANQPRSENDVSSLQLARLGPVVAAMEANLDTPLSTAELSGISGFSIRHMERKFQNAVGQSPAAFYRSLRLRRARILIEQTGLPVSEIAVASGFGTSSNFARRYAQEFGLSPSQRRAQLLAACRKNQRSTQSKGLSNASIPLSPCAPRPSLHTAGADEAAVRGA